MKTENRIQNSEYRIKRALSIVYCPLLIVLFAFHSSFVFASATYKVLDSATADYSKGNYAGAVIFYNQFLNSGLVSADVYYNLGNCFYKTNDIAKAVLYYEKAKKLVPSDADIQFNLQLANLKTTDKIPADSQLFLTNWWSNFVNLAPERGWAIICIVFLCLALALLLLYLFSRSLYLRQAGFWGAMCMLAFCLFSFVLARQQYETLTTHNTAVVMSASVTIKGSPADNGTQLFVIHEGAKVNIIKTEGAWTEVKLANGNQGWLLNTDIEAI